MKPWNRAPRDHHGAHSRSRELICSTWVFGRRWSSRPWTRRWCAIDPQPGARMAQLLSEARLRTFLTGSAHSSAPGDELAGLIARTAEVYAHSVTAGTRSTYARRWVLFQDWCERRGASALPASPETVMLYLTDAVEHDEAALSTLRGWMAAINRIHVEAGMRPPGAHPAMTVFLRGLSRVAPARGRPEPISAMRISGLRAVCRSIDGSAVDVTEVRDRALLGLHRAGVGDGELARLDWEQVHATPKTIVITVLPVGRQVATRVVKVRSSVDDAACPVAAMHAWMDMSGPEPDGHVFRMIKGGRLDRPMNANRVFTTRTSRCDALGATRVRADPADAMRLLGHRSTLALRDKAVLLIGFAGAFRRNELSELRWSDVHEKEAGLVIHLRRSKTDPEGTRERRRHPLRAEFGDGPGDRCEGMASSRRTAAGIDRGRGSRLRARRTFRPHHRSVDDP